MPAALPHPGNTLADIGLTDDAGRRRNLSELVAPSGFERRAGFAGPLLVLLTGRGWFCPRDRTHLKGLVARQDEIALNRVSMVYVAVQPPAEQAAFRAGLGADFAFWSDERRELGAALDVLDTTEGEYHDVLRPFAFVCDDELVVRMVHDGWWLAGRPTVDTLLADIATIRADLPGGSYPDWTDDRVTALRVPARVRTGAERPPGAALRRYDVTATVTTFDRDAGEGEVLTGPPGRPETLWFHFSAIAGTGYRTVEPGTTVVVDVAEHRSGPIAMNVRPVRPRRPDIT